GEGGSGGALGIAVADRVLMMQNSIYSVISPEGCASIMWRDASKKELAAQALRITAADLQHLGCIDGIISEPEGDAHSDHEKAAALVGAAWPRHLEDLKSMMFRARLDARYRNFRKMAHFYPQAVAADYFMQNPASSDTKSSTIVSHASCRVDLA